MPPKEIVCSKCAKTITKRQSRLVDGSRICKSHDEAVEFAEVDRKQRVAKAVSQFHVSVSKRNRSMNVSFRANYIANLLTTQLQMKDIIIRCVILKTYFAFFESLKSEGNMVERAREIVDKYRSEVTMKMYDKHLVSTTFTVHSYPLLNSLFDRLTKTVDVDDIGRELDKIYGEYKSYYDELEDLNNKAKKVSYYE